MVTRARRLVGTRLAPHAPLLLRTVDVAAAAALAWALVQPLGGLSDRYPYYASLGAVIGVSTTVLGSARGAVATVRNLVLGAALATGVQLLAVPEVVGLALVVAAATVLSGARALANGGSWIVYSAVVVLILGGDAPWEYGAAYAGLTSLGALVGIATVVTLPPLLITPGAEAVAEAGATLADQLEDLADALDDDSDQPPSAAQWERRRHDLRPTVRRLDDAVHALDEARRGNWRARWWRRSTADQLGRAALVGGTHPLVEHLVLVLVREERSDLDRVALGPALRPPVVAALRPWAASLRVVTLGQDDEAVADELADAVTGLVAAVHRSAAALATDDHLEAAAVATTVRLGERLLAETRDVRTVA